MDLNNFLLEFLSALLIILQLINNTSQYQLMNVENPDLCSIINKKNKIKLYNDERSGLIVKQTRLNDHILNWENNMLCKFKLQINSYVNGGIIAVIQNLSFRQNRTTDECIDYIQFMSKDGSSSRKFCGKFNAASKMDMSFVTSTDSVAVGNAYVDTRGEMDVYIYVAKEALKPDEDMDMTIAFTAYKHCPWPKTRYDELKIHECTKAHTYCIYKGFFNDSVINCPSYECVDEGGCGKKVPQEFPQSSGGDEIFYGALSSVFISFFIFVLCIIICRARNLFCFDQQCYHSRPQNEPSQPESRVVDITLTNPPPPLQPTVPVHEPIPARVDEDKDLPPAYETLFPSR